MEYLLPAMLYRPTNHPIPKKNGPRWNGPTKKEWTMDQPRMNQPSENEPTWQKLEYVMKNEYPTSSEDQKSFDGIIKAKLL